MDYRRDFTPGGVYFFTVVTYQRAPLLIDHIDRLRHAFAVEQGRNPFGIDGIVILPDHLHTIWRLPDGDEDYAGRWSRIKRLFSSGLPRMTKAASLVAKREWGVWQRRYWEHRIRDAQDWERHMDYIHYNPVKHGYATMPARWPYGSFERCVRRGWYEADWGAAEPEAVRGMDPE